MKNIYKKIIALTYITFFLIGFFVPFNFSFAQFTGVCQPPMVVGPNGCISPYVLLAPLPCDNGTAGCVNGKLETFNPETDNPLGEYLNTIIKIIIGLAAVLAVVMIVVGGIEYMTSELVSSKEAGKEKFTGAILGLLLALGAYALLSTINPNLLSTNINIKNEIVKVDLNADVPQTPVSVNGILRYGNYPVGADWTVIAGTTPSKPDWATINGPECTAVGQQNCTSTRGLGLSTLLTIHSNCTAPCPLIITGGTEFWLHGGATGSTTHQLGNSTVDLRPNTNLNNYIAGGQTLIRMKRYPKDGISYLWEGDHWHAGP